MPACMHAWDQCRIALTFVQSSIMIDTAISMLQRELENYLSPIDASATVVVDNVGFLETTNGDKLSNSIIISVVNLEEESTLKNQQAFRNYPSTGNAVYENAPVYLNLYVLFTCNYWGDKYIYALQRISYVVQFLQGRSTFSYGTSTGTQGTGTAGGFSDDPALVSLRFTMELYTLTFEQLNHLWGSLGGRQVPFAMYKLRLVALTDRKIIRTAPLIQEIDANLIPITSARP
jgi:Pvc16 N-terminal domain